MVEDQARGASAPVSLNVGVWLERFEAIDNVDWQSEVKYLRVFADLGLALVTSEAFLHVKVQRGDSSRASWHCAKRTGQFYSLPIGDLGCGRINSYSLLPTRDRLCGSINSCCDRCAWKTPMTRATSTDRR